jgi:deazaflavin-dependent oxidoreductase (nitroreductase family)
VSVPIDDRETAWNESTIADFRSHDGAITSGPLQGANILLLTSTGARSGQPHVAPLGYTRDGERYVVVGSNSGRSQHPAWLRNIQADPAVTVEVGPDRFPAVAMVTSGEERRRLLDAHIAAIPIFARYEGMAGRELPVVTLTRIT